MRVLYDASLETTDGGGIDGDDGLPCNLTQRKLQNICQHSEKTEELKLFPGSVSAADDVEYSRSDDAEHFGGDVGSRLPWFPDYVEEYTDDLTHL